MFICLGLNRDTQLHIGNTDVAEKWKVDLLHTGTQRSCDTTNDSSENRRIRIYHGVSGNKFDSCRSRRQVSPNCTFGRAQRFYSDSRWLIIVLLWIYVQELYDRPSRMKDHLRRSSRFQLLNPHGVQQQYANLSPSTLVESCLVPVLHEAEQTSSLSSYTTQSVNKNIWRHWLSLKHPKTFFPGTKRCIA